MNVSAKTEYACLAVLELAAHYGSGDPVRIRAIADAHGLPHGVLAQVLLQLKAAGVVSSTRGAAGGYQLVRSPEELTLAEVVAVVEGAPQPPTSSASIETAAGAALLDVWREASAARQGVFARATFADLVEKVAGANQNMYYI